MSSSRANFEAWDAAMARPSPDYYSLYGQMKAHARQRSNDGNAEVWWRLSSAAISLTLNLDPVIDREACKVRSAEARLAADRALKASPKHFQANMWMCISLGSLALLESCFLTALNYIGPLTAHLAECQSQKQDTEWRLLLVESNMHLMLWYGPVAYQQLLQQQPNNTASSSTNLPPRLPLSIIENKLKKALQLNGNSLEIHGSLMTAYIVGDKLTEAKKTGKAALELKRQGYRSEERMIQVVQELLKLLEGRAASSGSEKSSKK